MSVRTAHGRSPASAPGTRDAAGSRDGLVVYLSASGTLGGAERVLLDLTTGLAGRPGGPSQLVIAAADGPLTRALERAGVEVVTLPWPPIVARLGDHGVRGPGGVLQLALRAARAVPSLLGYLAALRGMLRERAPAIVHSNGFKMHVLAALAKPAGSRLVWHLHDFTASRFVMVRALRLLKRRCDVAIANSRSVADDARQAWGERPPAVPVLNAVDLSRFSPSGPVADLDEMAGCATPPEGTVRIGIVATLARWKGHEVFLRAVALLPRELRVRAYVVSGAVYETDGSQWALDELRAFASSLGLGDRVAFTGFAADAPSVMRALDVVVHASTRPEPFGLVIAEAMACGRAVVLSAAGGATELADDGRSALFSVPSDAVALASHLEALVRDAALRERLGAAAAIAARARFSLDRFAREVQDVHRSLLSGTRRGPG